MNTPQTEAQEMAKETPLLSTESRAEFESFSSDFFQDLQPRDAIETMYAKDVIEQTWEIIRLRTVHADIIKIEQRAALYRLLRFDLKIEGLKAEKLSQSFFADKTAKERVLGELLRYGLTETAITSAAYRKASEDLDNVDRRMASLEGRRHKALKRLSNHRKGLGAKAQEISDRLIERADAPRLQPSAEDTR
jgi:flagellar motility protein MotE (MotC chaperone)